MNPQNKAAQITDLLGQLARLMTEAEKPQQDSVEPLRRPRVLLTVDEAADQLGIGKTTTYALVRSGALQSVLIGRLRRIHVQAVSEYAARLVATQNSAA